MASKTVQSRKWYYDTSDWCKYEEQEDETTRAASWFDIQAEKGAKEDEKLEEENVPCVPAGENSELAACYLCHDQFEQFYNEKDEEWQLKNCVEKDKRLYHPMCHDDMIKTREEKIRKRNQALVEAKQLESQRIEIKEEQLELKLAEDVKIKDEKKEEIHLKDEEKLTPEKDSLIKKEIILEKEPVGNKEVFTEKEAVIDKETVTKTETIMETETVVEKETVMETETVVEKETVMETEIETINETETIMETETIKETEIIKETETIIETESIKLKENEERITDENSLQTEPVFQESQTEENNYEDLEIPDTMEIIQVTEVLSPKLVDEPIVENITSSSSSPNTQEIVPEEIKPKSPSPVSTMTCSIDGNTDTEWNIPVAPAMGTIKINISQKITPVVKPIIRSENTSIEPQSPPDFTQTFGEIDPDQPPPPGLEMETVVAPKIQREMKPRLMLNAKKLKEYPIVNKGKEMSGLCSIM